MTLNVHTRETGGVTVMEIEGRVLVGEASAKLHDAVREQLTKGARKIVLQLRGVTYIDSSGVGEMVSALSATRKAGGELKLSDLAPKVRDLMQMTNLNKIFELTLDEAAAIQALGK